METLILIALGILALTIIGLRIRRTIKGLAQDEATNNCAGCGGCCSSACQHKED